MQIAFPFRIDGRGRTAEAPHDEHVRDLLAQLLFTAAGERVNRPTLGTGLMALVHEPKRDDLAATTQLLVQGALQQWLGDVLEVETIETVGEESALRVTVRYRLRATGERHEATLRQAVP